MFDCSAFLNRMGWKQKDLAQRLESSTSRVGMWCSGKSYPYYGDIVKMIGMGMTLEELFGKEIAEKLVSVSNSSQDDSHPIYSSPEFKKGVQEAVAEALLMREKL